MMSKMKHINEILKEHPFFKGFTADEIDFISSCAKNKVFHQNEIIAHENQSADEFYLIRQGKVAICSLIPNQGNIIIQTIGEGEILGWSWIFPPYQWMFEVIASESTRTISLNGKCLREKLEKTPDLGYKLMKRFAQLMIARLNATRLQLLDIYGKKG
jgi:CRP-like cAMP-binding protein